MARKSSPAPNTSDEHKLVVTIPPDLFLSNEERSVLSKGLNFVPLDEPQNDFEVRRDVEAFFRRLRLQYHFYQEDTSADESEISEPDPFENLQPTKSKWTPPNGENKTLDRAIDKCREDLEPYFRSQVQHKKNLSKDEAQALKKLKANSDIIIKSADKGGAVVVWDRQLYTQEANRQLSDTNTYTRIQGDPISANQEKVSKSVKDLIKKKDLPATAKNLIHPCPQTANFYMLPKIHKLNTPGRPIVSSHSCPTVYIATYLDSILIPLVQKLPTYVQDSPHMLRILKDFHLGGPGDKFLFTMDIASLYTCLPHDLCMKALQYYLNQRHDQSIKTDTLLKLFESCLRNQ